ncbi:hypothetical protein B0T16DRAFT_411564 [Cercophora newfieldiana]|uniref:Uncharacterized protein n=1 Tax=Cercophora newfieldiana TaxID=92897 RepID=A0AA40CQ79_9PEZI|nr:hypothetical protein B0T16DRAFT_411564 [Cercophora newfieldiana]
MEKTLFGVAQKVRRASIHASLTPAAFRCGRVDGGSDGSAIVGSGTSLLMRGSTSRSTTNNLDAPSYTVSHLHCP